MSSGSVAFVLAPGSDSARFANFLQRVWVCFHGHSANTGREFTEFLARWPLSRSKFRLVQFYTFGRCKFSPECLDESLERSGLDGVTQTLIRFLRWSAKSNSEKVAFLFVSPLVEGRTVPKVFNPRRPVFFLTRRKGFWHNEHAVICLRNSNGCTRSG